MNKHQELIESLVYETAVRGCSEVSADSLIVLQEAIDRESSPKAKAILQAMVDNVRIARDSKGAICQSPGYPTCWLSFGDDNMPVNVAETVRQAIVVGTKNGILRPSLVDAITRRGDGQNSGKTIPNMEYEYHPGQKYVDFYISLKGCGAEWKNYFTVMSPAQFGENFSGLKRIVLETALRAGGKPCTPFAMGIGLGGQMDVAAKLSRKGVSIRKWNDENPDPTLNAWEKELKEQINSLGIGAAGIGGDTCCLAVKIEKAETHTAILPVAINFHCWAARRAGVRIYDNGCVETLL